MLWVVVVAVEVVVHCGGVVVVDVVVGLEGFAFELELLVGRLELSLLSRLPSFSLESPTLPFSQVHVSSLIIWTHRRVDP